jgi:adenine-specific DNA-methyltransferase
MSRLTDLIHNAKGLDPQLGLDLETEFRALLKRRSFGLVFERHRPEAVELPQQPVRKGDTVRILPPRGSMEKGDKRLWRVLKIVRNNGSRMAHLIEVGKEIPERISVTLKDVVVIAAFREHAA